MLDEKFVWNELGEEGFRKLVKEFYRRMKRDDLIGPMYPPDDWEGAEERFFDFLCMRIGGKTDYIEKRGHPRLRGRHMPFRIGVKERDRWLEIMEESMKNTQVSQKTTLQLTAFFAQVADFMRNQPEDASS